MRACYVLQKASSLGDGSCRALLHIILEKGSGFLVRLGRSPGALFGGEGVSLLDTPRVSLDRGETHIEKASRLDFGHASLYGGDYLLTEIFGIGFHPPMIAYGSSFMLIAVEALARENGVRVLHLETNRALKEAIELYRKSGFEEVARFNDEPYAHHWFEKKLT